MIDDFYDFYFRGFDGETIYIRPKFSFIIKNTFVDTAIILKVSDTDNAAAFAIIVHCPNGGAIHKN